MSQAPKRILIFIVAYNAEKKIQWVIDRIPNSLFERQDLSIEILVIDDSSRDKTFQVGTEIQSTFQKCPLHILRNPQNLGYGGNQKIGYHYAVDNQFDAVALIHGDGQYAPEELPRLLEPILQRSADAVFGSRMMESGNALKGGMPLYKYFGNKILTRLQNLLIGTNLSEFHSGYRLYSCEGLKKIPFEKNSDGFDFDTDIILQLHGAGLHIQELPIPTFYGDEVCHVNGFEYAGSIIWTSLLFRIQKLGIFYDARFDVTEENHHYVSKFDFTSSHQRSLEALEPKKSILLLGCGPLPLVEPFLEKSKNALALDLFVDTELKAKVPQSFATDLNTVDYQAFDQLAPREYILALDIIEHLQSPELFLQKIRHAKLTRDAKLILTTANIAFLPIRLMLLLGLFQYGKRGILDKTHTRLFTFSSLKKLFIQEGFTVLKMEGIPAPIPLAVGRNAFGFFLLKLNTFFVKIHRGLFSYQIFIEAKAKPTSEYLLEQAHQHSESQRATHQIEQKISHA
jgi:glycosyltransferase involved in cell wall biosynthesis